MHHEKIDNLKGKVIKEIKVIGDEEYLVFVLENDEEVSFYAEADCCSESWIEHFDPIDEPATIIDFKEVPIKPTFEETPTKHDHFEDEMEYNFYELVTDKGSYMIEMRNSSNGYYGGCLV